MEQNRLVLGGGCFWCTEAVFLNVKGVESVQSAYTGGLRANPSYENICTGVSGHAEVIDIVYNSDIIQINELLEIFFEIHDPTTLNAQGADKGTQYRSVIYYESMEDKNIILKAIEKAQENFRVKIVTEVSELGEVYPAEAYHNNYYQLNSTQGYCQVVIAPKLKKFITTFSKYTEHHQNL